MFYFGAGGRIFQNNLQIAPVVAERRYGFYAARQIEDDPDERRLPIIRALQRRSETSAADARAPPARGSRKRRKSAARKSWNFFICASL